MESEALARAVIAKLRRAGQRAYLVGGCVRDLLLGVQPKDYDIATDARPDRIMDLFPNSGRVGAHFGVVLVRDVFSQVEVATFRSDQEYSDGRRPDAVHFETDPANVDIVWVWPDAIQDTAKVRRTAGSRRIPKRSQRQSPYGLMAYHTGNCRR